MALGPGSIAFTGFNADGNDNLAFVALDLIPAGTVIYFNDQEWQGTNFNTGEGQVVWTATADIAAGTIVTINSFGSSPVSNLGSTSGSSGLGSDSEIVYAYIGSAFTPTAFLAAIANDGFAQSGGTLLGTGLVVGQTAIDLSNGGTNPGEDVAVFNGLRTGQASFAAYAAVINNPANWLTQDGNSGDQSIDGNAPDLPFSTDAFTTGGVETQQVGFAGTTLAQAEGNAGTTAFTFTVSRSGGTTGQVDFSGSFAATSTDAADYIGGSAPTGFSGSIAAGASSATVTINVAGDTLVELTESFSLTLTTVTNTAGIATSIGAAANAIATITNDDFAVPSLAAGDIAFTALNTDGDDNLAFVALKDIPAGATIFFQDNEWTGAAFNSGESAFTWTANAAIAAGTVVTINTINSSAPTSALGAIQVVDASNPGFAAGGEIVYAFVGTSATSPTAFLAAIATDGFEIPADSATLTGTGLTAGVNAVAFAGGVDIVEYSGSRANQSSFAAYGAVLANAANFATQNAGGDQGTDGIGPDVPFNATAFSLAAPGQTIGFAAASQSLSKAEGNGGSRSFIFTVERAGGTSGQLDFSGTIASGPTDAADFGGTLPTLFNGSIAAGAASGTVTVTFTGDTTIEADESFSLTITGGTNSLLAAVTVNAPTATATATIVNDDATLSIGGIDVYDAAPSLAGSTTTPVASNDVVLVRLGSIQGTIAGAESVAYENGKVYATNIAGNAINVHSVTAAGTLVNETPISLVGLPSYLSGGVNSVDVKNGIIAVGYENANTALPGFVALFNAADNSLIKTVQVGILPDDVTFTPDGTKLLVANEGEALSANGSISIIDLSGGAAAAFVSNTIGFSSLNGAEAVLRDRGVQVIPGQPAAGDIEPEHITISADGTRAYVTLQEVNSVAVIDLTNPTADRPIAIQALGTVNFNLPGNAIDPSDQDGPPVPPSATGTASINIRNVPVQGLLQPDAIATFDVAGVTYFVTANEGDSRVNVTDLVRFNSNGYILDPTAFPNAAALKAAANLGRLNVSNNVGDTDGDGDIDVIHTIGGRGISIFRQNADGTITKVRETGGEFEAITAQLVPGSFNSNQSVSGFDGRSDDKGPEPEGVTIGVIGGRTYAFVGLERVGGYMVYDVTDPANASFVSYKPQTAQDLGPETSAFVSAANSPTGQALLLSGQEISNTVTLYSIQTQTEGDDTIKGGVDGETWNGRGGNDNIAGNGGNDNIIGGAGTDTAVFRGVRAGYLVTNNGTVVTDINLVDGDDGTDTLSTVEFLAFSDQTVSTQSFVTYRLQLLHLSDGEAGLLAPTTAPLLAALFDRFEDQVANSITIAGGDTYIPGPFLAGGTDPSLSLVLNAVAGTTFAAGALAPIAAVDTAIHNIIGVEVSGIGNHEWDLGSNVYQASITPGTSSTNPGWVGANYISLTANLNFNPGSGIPADAINGRFTNTPAQAGLEEASSLKGRVAPSAVVTEGGEKIGFVGVTTQVLEAISSPTGAEVIGFPFGPGPNGEVDNMALLAQQLQPVIDDLRNQGVNKIVLLSHLQLLSNEKTLAPLLKGVDIILAAGSNTRLGDANDTAVAFPGHAATFADTYPLVLNDADGKTTLIVNTDNEYTYLGRLVVDFDGNGDIILSSLAANTAINGAYAATVDNVAAAYGVNAADVYTSDAFAAGSKGARVKALTDAVNTVIQVKDGNVFGFSDAYLEGDRTAVRTEESNLGNVTADANADALRDALGLGASDPVISIKNGGGIRAQIGSLVNNPDGTVTKVGPSSVSQLDVENSLRFDNALMVFDTTAQGLKAILEHSVSQTAPGATPGRFGQIGGISFSFNPAAAVGSRVSDIAIINEDNQIIATLYDNGVLQAGVPTVIRAVTLNFLANGGDSYPIKANGENFRYLLSDGTLGPILDETLNFESARPANALGEIRALQEYFGERYATPATAFNQADTPESGDLRIQNTGARSDTVLFADYFLNGNGLDNTVVGNNGDSVLQGFGGNDVMIGGAGADRIIGGDGFDTASFATASAGVVVDLSTGRGSGGDAAGDRYEGIEALLGSGFDDIFTGSRTSDTLDGAAGNDVIIAARGADTLIGSAGDDVLIGGLDADTFMFGSVDNGSVDYIVDFLRGEGDTLIFGPGVTVLAASVGFLTTPASVNGQSLANGDRALDLVLTLGSAAGTQTVHVLDAYNFASNEYWEGVLGLELSYPRPLPVGAELLPIA